MTDSDNGIAFSVIVPTWNEEVWLPRLLNTLSASSRVAEIIVADNGSTDETVRVAQGHKCRLAPGGRPAAARNSGAALASSSYLLFVDADAVPLPEVLESTALFFQDHRVIAVHPRLVPLSQQRLHKVAFWLMTTYFRLLASLGLHQGVGPYIAVRRHAFETVNGFDPEVLVGEDTDLFRRLRRVGRIVFAKELIVWISPRRFAIENYWLFCAKCVLWALLRRAGSRKSIMDYKWREYPADLLADENELLDRELAARDSEGESVR